MSKTPKKHLPSVARRIRAGKMLMAGETIESVVQQLGISTPSAKRYKALLEEGGLARWRTSALAEENLFLIRRPSTGSRKRLADRRQRSVLKPADGRTGAFNRSFISSLV